MEYFPRLQDGEINAVLLLGTQDLLVYLITSQIIPKTKLS
jgi:hypothetical protein